MFHMKHKDYPGNISRGVLFIRVWDELKVR